MKEIMEIKASTSSMRLYPSPTYGEWFNSHDYDWRRKNRDFKEIPNKEIALIYKKAIARHLKWQGTLIKTFMQNCNGKKSK